MDAAVSPDARLKGKDHLVIRHIQKLASTDLNEGMKEKDVPISHLPPTGPIIYLHPTNTPQCAAETNW